MSISSASIDDRGHECLETACESNQGFDDWDLFQAGGIIFF